jgi:hypothetical protein
MAGDGWGQGNLPESTSETGLAELLLAYITYGGQLWGARRWQDSPLTLTHVRWQGPAGQFLDAARHQGDDSYLSPGERAAWVQLALHYPAVSAPMTSGLHGPWVALTLDRSAAQSLVAGMPRTPSVGSPPHRSYPSPPDRTTPQPGRTPSQAGWQQPQTGDPRWSIPLSPNSPWGAGGMGLAGGESFGMSSPGIQMPGGWSSSGETSQDLSVIPCVEIDLPASSGDYPREYAREIAIRFARAVRALPQAHELRGWMRGSRMVLAARMVFGTGRFPTPADMNNAAQLLADVLGQSALPYTRLAFADPAEWNVGAPLPE